ncbi:hypothetical protein CRUP_025351 [Coryphaenoides rupestris]|nr:hypothetical protein CRUP_025351 [Coryphaenoides rupestris]
MRMCKLLAARYASPPAHSGLGTPQKKNTRLPGPSRGPAAGGVAPRSPASSNLNRRSQSFNSIDKSKPLQYASGNDRESMRAGPAAGSMGGVAAGSMGGGAAGSVEGGAAAVFPSSPGGQQPVGSAIPSLAVGKSWRSKSMNLKHSATASMLGSPAPSPTPPADRLPKPGSGVAGSGASSQSRSMLEKFRMIHPRVSARASPSDTLPEEEDPGEGGEGGEERHQPSAPPPASPARASTKTPAAPGKTPACSSSSPPSSSSSCSSKGSASSGNKAPPPREEGRRPGRTGPRPAGSPEAEQTSKKTSRIASLIPKGGKPAAGRKESSVPPSSTSSTNTSSIPKSGLKAPSSKPQCQSPVPTQTQTQTSLNSSGNCGPPGARRTSMTSSTSTSALSGTGGGGGVGVVQLPQQQQHHPNTATVAPFMYRTFSENDCSMVVPVETGLSPTKGELVYSRGGYSKTAKQCLQEISESCFSHRGGGGDRVSAELVGQRPDPVKITVAAVAGATAAGGDRLAITGITELRC